MTKKVEKKQKKKKMSKKFQGNINEKIAEN